MTAFDVLGVSPMCLGTMYFGTTVRPTVAFALLDMAVSAGVTSIDTANKYACWLPHGMGGESERLLGSWIRERGNRNRLTIATKIGLAMPGVEAGLRAKQIETLVEESLQRLDTDHIDLLYAHADDRRTQLAETMTAFARLIHAGKVRAIGASNYSSWRLAQAHAAGGIGFSCLQVRHSLLRADPWLPQDFPIQIPATPELLDCCRSLELRILAYSPLLGGAYCRDDRRLPPAYRTRANARRLAAARSLAEARKITVNQVVLAWLLSSDPPVIPVITGSRPEQLAENLAAMHLRLEPGERDGLDAAALLDSEHL